MKKIIIFILLLSSVAYAQTSSIKPSITRTKSTWIKCDNPTCIAVSEAITNAIGREISTRSIERDPSTDITAVSDYRNKLASLKVWANSLPDGEVKNYYLLLIDRRDRLASHTADVLSGKIKLPTPKSISGSNLSVPVPPMNLK